MIFREQPQGWAGNTKEWKSKESKGEFRGYQHITWSSLKWKKIVHGGACGRSKT